MLSVNIICIGAVKEKHFTDAYNEYAKRLTAFCKLTLIEIPEYKLPDNPSFANINDGLIKEGRQILSKIPKNSYKIALAVEGKQKSSEEMAELLKDISNKNSMVTLIIGGSYGLSDEVKNTCDIRLSFSKMTFPHQLMRVILAEQLYRAFTINAGTKYHK